jgi:hypothetical protein
MTKVKHSEDAQISLVLKHLESGRKINPLEALSLYGCYRLGAIIFMLKAEGYNISSEVIHYKKENGRRGKYAVYRLEA